MLQLASKEQIESVRHKFQFLTILTIFFPVALEAVFLAFQQEVQASYNIMSWSVVVAVLVLNYLAIEYLRDKMPVVVVRYSDIFITLSIFLYVPVFVVFSMFRESSIPYFYSLAMGVGIVGTMVVPTALFIILSGYIAKYFSRKEIIAIYRALVQFLSGKTR